LCTRQSSWFRRHAGPSSTDLGEVVDRLYRGEDRVIQRLPKSDFLVDRRSAGAMHLEAIRTGTGHFPSTVLAGNGSA
jgi:hypothetical protein